MCQISKSEEKVPLKVAIIGGGTAGLVSAKYAIAQGHDVTIFEQSEELGGIWVYSDKIGTNKYGVKIHSPMYTGLRYILMSYTLMTNISNFQFDMKQKIDVFQTFY